MFFDDDEHSPWPLTGMTVENIAKAHKIIYIDHRQTLYRISELSSKAVQHVGCTF